MLQFSELKKRNLLSSEFMSNVRGGGSCGYEDAAGRIGCDIPKATAMSRAGAGGHWCCDSCSSSSYCSGSRAGTLLPAKCEG